MLLPVKHSRLIFTCKCTAPAISNSKPPASTERGPASKLRGGYETPQVPAGILRGHSEGLACGVHAVDKLCGGPTKAPQQNQEQLYALVNMSTFYDSVNC